MEEQSHSSPKEQVLAVKTTEDIYSSHLKHAEHIMNSAAERLVSMQFALHLGAIQRILALTIYPHF